ncbi:Serine/threonine-protein kinase PknB [Rosistilla carotiformis]|uniref:non-specific serine/threonine protein kinase n=1 Tax=Rosistilla carotiformis TaxID=2528017 RepID=A0A518K1L7_9BACT|nr:serine/threonine-protein kinase [Rosistilla carotiformis]QDV71706.1 Serine/threonine-protein kinase PknB [Rosistilla carotiformis]
MNRPLAPSESSADDELDADTIAGTDSSVAGARLLAAPHPGTIIDDYEIIDEIARGGMGVVYRARQRSLGRIVALKMVLPGEATTDKDRQRFANEARAAADLDHPGIVPVFDVGVYGGQPYFTMAYVNGESLSAKLHDGPLSPPQAAAIARDVARAISTAHDRQIVHRDLKPANILMEPDGQPRITDFGVCKSIGPDTAELTLHGGMIGTPHFMPPEQAQSTDEPVGPTADVYSIGAVLYTMLTGRPPFLAASAIEVVAQVIAQVPVRPSQLNPRLRGDLETITLKCLEKRPRDRYPTAAALAEDLQRYLDGDPIQARPPGLWRMTTHLIRRQVLLASVSGSVALLITTLCVCLSFAFFDARQRLFEVTQQKEQLQRQLTSERSAALAYVRRTDTTGDAVLRYRIERWQQIAAALAVEQSESALPLALHAAQVSLDAGLPISEPLRTLLRDAVADADAEAVPELSDRQLVEYAALSAPHEFTDSDRIRFDLPDPQPQ